MSKKRGGSRKGWKMSTEGRARVKVGAQRRWERERENRLQRAAGRHQEEI